MASELRPEDIKYTYPGQHIYDGVVMSVNFPPEAIDSARKANIHSSDVVLATYPKSGTTWMEEILWLLLNDLDYSAAAAECVEYRCLSLELKHPVPEKHEAMQNLPTPRVVKTHLYHRLLEDAISVNEPKVVVVMRNPKDVLVSFYNYYCFNLTLGCYKGTWDEFFELFKNDELQFGVLKDHVGGWWANKGKPNYHFVKYEDLKKRPSEIIADLAYFLGVKLGEKALDKLVNHVSFESMKNNKMVNRELWQDYDLSVGKFIRKGKIGDWKNYFTEEQSSYVDGIVEELSKKGLTFDFE